MHAYGDVHSYFVTIIYLQDWGYILYWRWKKQRRQNEELLLYRAPSMDIFTWISIVNLYENNTYIWLGLQKSTAWAQITLSYIFTNILAMNVVFHFHQFQKKSIKLCNNDRDNILLVQVACKLWLSKDEKMCLHGGWLIVAVPVTYTYVVCRVTHLHTHACTQTHVLAPHPKLINTHMHMYSHTHTQVLPWYINIVINMTWRYIVIYKDNTIDMLSN